MENIVHTYGRNIFLCMKGFRKKIRGWACMKLLNLLSPSALSFAFHNPRSEVNWSARGLRARVRLSCLGFALLSFGGLLYFFPSYCGLCTQMYGNGMSRNSRIVTRLGRCHNINATNYDATKFNFDLLVFRWITIRT